MSGSSRPPRSPRWRPPRPPRSREAMVELVRSKWTEVDKTLDLRFALEAYTGEEISILMSAIVDEKPQLLILYLQGNTIGDVGATKIAETLPSLPQLQGLNLNSNAIGAAGAMRIAEMLPGLTQLQGLTMDVDPNKLQWREMGWTMSEEVLGAAKHVGGSIWNWGAMAGRMSAKARETTEWLPPHVRAKLDGSRPESCEGEEARSVVAQARAEAEAILQTAKRTLDDAESDRARIVSQAQEEADRILELARREREGVLKSAGGSCVLDPPLNLPAKMVAQQCAGALTPRDYIEKLTSGEQVQKDAYDLSNLAGRLCGGKEPKDFRSLGFASGSERGTCFVLGGDGLGLLLEPAGSGTAPLEMLLKAGYDIVEIHDKVAAGWAFELCVFEKQDATVHMRMRMADWEGVCAVVTEAYPIAGHAMAAHLPELKAAGCGVGSDEAVGKYWELQKRYGEDERGWKAQERGSDYSFASDRGSERQMTYATLTRLQGVGTISAGAVRKFLYDTVQVDDRYAGDGKTRLADGTGIDAYLGLGTERSKLTSLASTMLGAPTPGECVEHMSDRYEQLRMEQQQLGERGAQKPWKEMRDLDRWLPAAASGEAGAKVGKAAREEKERVVVTPRECAKWLLFSDESPLQDGQLLDGVGFSLLAVGNGAAKCATLGGPTDSDSKVVRVGCPSQLQKLLRNERGRAEALLDLLMDVGWTLRDVYQHVERGGGFRLVLVRWRPWAPTFPDSVRGKEQFPATLEGVLAFCRTCKYDDVADALQKHRAEVCKALTQTQYDAWAGKSVDGSDVMTYDRFKRSVKDAEAVRQFVFQTLCLRGGWNGSGAERSLLDDSEQGSAGTAVFIAQNRNLAELLPDECSVVQLGAPSMADVVLRLKRGLEKLRLQAPAQRRGVKRAFRETLS